MANFAIILIMSCFEIAPGISVDRTTLSDDNLVNDLLKGCSNSNRSIARNYIIMVLNKRAFIIFPKKWNTFLGASVSLIANFYLKEI